MILIATCIFLFLIVIFLSYKLYQFSIIILDFETKIEESLDVLNYHYGEINKILQKEIFFDSVEVRQCIASIRESHDAILRIANNLVKVKGENEKKENKTNKKPDKVNVQKQLDAK